jgi:signal transduction histidine kinase
MTDTQLDVLTTLDGLGQGVLIFGSDGRHIMENLAARTLLGTDITLIRQKGWEAAQTLLNANKTNPDEMIEVYRDEALKSERPVRFYIYRSGEHIPCWAASVLSQSGEVCTMITIDRPDWTALGNLMHRIRDEINDALYSTQGHIDIITQTIEHHSDSDEVMQLSKRLTGFTRLISTHMSRTGRLMEMLERLENIRTGKLRTILRNRRRRLDLAEFFEDFVEELDELPLVDPETDAHDHRSRLSVDVPDHLEVDTSSTYLTRILHDILRNAIMYSMKATPLRIKAQLKGQNVQIDVTDEGYGIRERERERVFEPFQRARQPQIISEFGYGLSLYLCKHEVEMMNGRLWFESDEGIGTTFSFMLPVWRDVSDAPSSSDT